jgi:hypothetical protein
MRGNPHGRQPADPPEETIEDIAARGVQSVRASIAGQSWRQDLLSVGAGPDEMGTVIVVRVRNRAIDRAFAWREQYGPSYGPCRILVRSEDEP